MLLFSILYYTLLLFLGLATILTISNKVILKQVLIHTPHITVLLLSVGCLIFIIIVQNIVIVITNFWSLLLIRVYIQLSILILLQLYRILLVWNIWWLKLTRRYVTNTIVCVVVYIVVIDNNITLYCLLLWFSCYCWWWGLLLLLVVWW